jgi:hypothetical protein
MVQSGSHRVAVVIFSRAETASNELKRAGLPSDQVSESLLRPPWAHPRVFGEKPAHETGCYADFKTARSRQHKGRWGL